MKRYPLQMLITARQIRLDAALAEVTRARGVLNEKIAAHDRIVKQREAKQRSYEQQRDGLFLPADEASDPHIVAIALGQREHNLGLLLEQLAQIDQARFAAQSEMEEAHDVLRNAIKLHQRAQTKLDLLLERKKHWRMAEQRSVDARDEVFAEEIFLAQHVREKRDATTPSRH
jgi:hypothetical protein